MDYIIEIATAEDAEGIVNLRKVCGMETDNLTYGKEGPHLSVEQQRRNIERILNSEKDVFYVAKMDGEIVGSADYFTFPKERMAHRGEFGICVRKSAWGQGIGHALMSKILDFAKNTAQAEIISLEVRTDNTRAIKLYQDFGFRKLCTFEGFFKIDGKLVDFDIMQLKLK